MTDGPDLAERQLRELAAVSGGSVEVLATQDIAAGRRFTISMDTSGLPAGAGIKVRDRERFHILAGPDYPHRHPSVWVPHRRWAKSPHVQWGRYLCLYAAPSVEWMPSGGMDSFIERLAAWVVRAAAGTLDPDGQPLHPPIAYPAAEAGVVVIYPDVGNRAPWAAGPGDLGEPPVTSMVAWCTLTGDRVDVLEWTSWLTAYDRVLTDGFSPLHGGRPLVVMPVLLISGELGFEYPDRAWDLVTALGEAGFSLDSILAELADAIIINRVLRTSQVRAGPDAADRPFGADLGGEDASAPLLTGLLIGTPSRRVDDVRLAHLAAWRLGGPGQVLAGAYADFRHRPGRQELLGKVGEVTRDWLAGADVRWMRVLENRPEITRRRDQGTPASWLAGKRILVLGCGALGAPAGESCVRAGAAALQLVDNGLVTPGILIRQPYTDADISQPKATVLAGRLAAITARAAVQGRCADALDLVLQPGLDMSGFDLIIDATADAGVRSAIERQRRVGSKPWPPLVTMVIGHDATRGLVTISLPESTGAGSSALRQVALHAFTSPGEWADIADDFFPAEPRTEMFFPEPGCSAPTFTGGYTQTTALAGLLLDEALLVLSEQAASDLTPRMTGFASAVRIGPSAVGHGTSRTQWGPDIITVDSTLGYEVRLSPAAVTVMRTEARRGARVRGPRIETGGMLLGAFDDAAGVIYADRVTGPPPDSFLSATYFQHGQVGTREAVDAYLESSRAMTGFVGYWHTHPGGSAAPSPTDEEGMASVLTPAGRRQRALMIIVGGREDQWDRWVAGKEAQPAVFARVVLRGGEITVGGTGGFATQRLPVGAFFRGGFSPPALVSGKKDPGGADTSFRVADEVVAVAPQAQSVTGGRPRIGLALSGGGFRATAFGLGALRALHDRGVLADVTVVSGISGGSLLAAMWAYGPQNFNEFDTSVTSLVTVGLQWEIARRAVAPRAVLADVASLTRAVAGKPFGGQRSFTRTEALVEALAARPFGQRQLRDVTHPGLATVISATDLATGNAVRFGSEISSLSSVGDITDPVPVADAIAASAAFPALLPHLSRTYTFTRRDGTQERRALRMTDGGVYDNLGITPLLPRRSAAHTSHVYDLDYIIAVDAGQGRLVRAAPDFMPGRLWRTFQIAYRRAQDGSRAQLNRAVGVGAIQGFIHAYLATRDERLPLPLADLVPCDAVVHYPTDFAQMPPESLQLIATRGEQVTRILIEHYCPQLGPG